MRAPQDDGDGVTGIKNSRHPEEAEKRLSRRTHGPFGIHLVSLKRQRARGGLVGAASVWPLADHHPLPRLVAAVRPARKILDNTRNNTPLPARCGIPSSPHPDCRNKPAAPTADSSEKRCSCACSGC